MRSLLRSLLLVVALLFSQHAAMLHGLAHAQHDVALAEHGGGKAPALDHGVDECAAYFAFAHALGNAAVSPLFASINSHLAVVAIETPAVATRIVFDSRAPPLSA
jgi:hypothetical protein